MPNPDGPTREDAHRPIEPIDSLATGPPHEVQSLQVRFLQILADKVVESIRDSPNNVTSPRATAGHSNV
jgi:hypothetical protein